MSAASRARPPSAATTSAAPRITATKNAYWCSTPRQRGLRISGTSNATARPRLLRAGGHRVAHERPLAGIAIGVLDEIVGRRDVAQPAGLHAEVLGLRVVGDDRDRRLLGIERVAAAEAQADRRGVDEAEELLVLGLLGHRGVAP